MGRPLPAAADAAGDGQVGGLGACSCGAPSALRGAVLRPGPGGRAPPLRAPPAHRRPPPAAGLSSPLLPCFASRLLLAFSNVPKRRQVNRAPQARPLVRLVHVLPVCGTVVAGSGRCTKPHTPGARTTEARSLPILAAGPRTGTLQALAGRVWGGLCSRLAHGRHLAVTPHAAERGPSTSHRPQSCQARAPPSRPHSVSGRCHAAAGLRHVNVGGGRDSVPPPWGRERLTWRHRAVRSDHPRAGGGGREPVPASRPRGARGRSLAWACRAAPAPTPRAPRPCPLVPTPAPQGPRAPRSLGLMPDALPSLSLGAWPDGGCQKGHLVFTVGQWDRGRSQLRSDQQPLLLQRPTAPTRGADSRGSAPPRLRAGPRTGQAGRCVSGLGVAPRPRARPDAVSPGLGVAAHPHSSRLSLAVPSCLVPTPTGLTPAVCPAVRPRP